MKNRYLRSRQGVRSPGELHKALEHFHVHLLESELFALFNFFPMTMPDGTKWFDFDAFAATLYPRVGDEDRPYHRETLLYEPDYSSSGFGRTQDPDDYLGYSDGVTFPQVATQRTPMRTPGRTQRTPSRSQETTFYRSGQRVGSYIHPQKALATIEDGVTIKQFVHHPGAYMEIIPSKKTGLNNIRIESFQNNGRVYITQDAFDRIGSFVDLGGRKAGFGTPPARRGVNIGSDLEMTYGKTVKNGDFRKSRW
jgi:hypothetical protein